MRKKESALFLASQNLEDFTQPGIRELTRPLFSIPVHQFIFNGGNVDKKFFMDNLQLEESEYVLILPLQMRQRAVSLAGAGPGVQAGSLRNGRWTMNIVAYTLRL